MDMLMYIAQMMLVLSCLASNQACWLAVRFTTELYLFNFDYVGDSSFGIFIWDTWNTMVKYCLNIEKSKLSRCDIDLPVMW